MAAHGRDPYGFWRGATPSPPGQSFLSALHDRWLDDSDRRDADPWAWVDEDEEPRPASTSPAAGHRRAGHLRRRPLAAGHPGRLARLQHRPTRLIAIDNDSTDGTRTCSNQAVARACWTPSTPASARFGFGSRGQVRPAPGRRAGRAGEPLALAAARRRRSPRPTRSSSCWPTSGRRPQRSTSPGPSCCCRAAGRPASRSARSGSASPAPAAATSSWTPGEIDQGQRDQPQARLGVSTCGMLVRTDGLERARTGWTRPSRSSATASSSAGAPTSTATGWSPPRVPWSPTARWAGPGCGRRG